ncbi:MAG: hypothetical protein WA687_13715 [Solirubrobacterales bacterium]
MTSPLQTRPGRIAALIALAAALLLAAATFVLPAGDAAGQVSSAPRGFFGIAPQTALTDTDAEYMRAARIGSVRWPLAWGGVHTSRKGELQWDSIDEVVATAARQRLRVLPFVYSTPAWLSPKYTTLPVNNARQRGAWVSFLRAAVERYGPEGEFWREHGPGSAEPLPKIPLREWQIWNEANFFYFTYPVSPQRYAQTLQLARGAIESVDPGATIVLSGLFGDPDEEGSRGMAAADFLEALYAVPGIKAAFDGIALHPYAVDAETLAEQTEEIREIALENGDPSAGLYITEMGWGSQNNFQQVAFEQGISGQVKQLRDSYAYLLENRHRLNIKSTYWFTWKDMDGSCNFCDSTGLFRRGDHFKPKPAWHAFVRLSRGRARP